jgi:hypothetical protein
MSNKLTDDCSLGDGKMVLDIRVLQVGPGEFSSGQPNIPRMSFFIQAIGPGEGRGFSELRTLLPTVLYTLLYFKIESAKIESA